MTEQRTETGPAPGDEAKRSPLLIEAEVSIIGHRQEMAVTREHTIYCDEATRIGGGGTAPSPLQYFVSSVVF